MSSTTTPSSTTPSATTVAPTTTPTTSVAPTTTSATTTPSATTVVPTTTSVAPTTTPVATTTPSSSDNYYDNKTMMMTIAFLGIYFSVYAISGMFFKRGDPNFHSALGGTVDLIVFALIILFSLLYYFTLSDADQSTFFDDFKKGLRDYFNNAYSILEVVIFIALFYLGVYVLKIPMSYPDKSMSIAFFESKALIWLFLLIAVQFFKEVLGIRIVDHIYNMDFNFGTPKPTETPGPTIPMETTVTLPAPKEEVFNISNNLFTFDDAQKVCKSFDARLATYDEIEDAYEQGAEWSSYGWSDKQHAYFPTQKDTWQNLQGVKGHEHDLGRPGVNGGYFKNPNIRFGVNCFGVKPAMTDAEKARMSARKDQVYPKTEKDELLDKKVKFFQEHKDKLLIINGYNTDKWSKY